MKTQNLTRKWSSLITRVYIKCREKIFSGLPYIYEKKGSDSLLIVFSAFTGNKRRFNYVRSFKDLRCDKLFLLDPWGHLGSYNLYENGEDYPRDITQRLVNEVIGRGGYRRVYAAGSSKGGTEAIYFGLSVKADAIFTGACQYNLGTYLWREEFRPIFYGMMGKDAGEKEVELLNDAIRGKLRDNEGCKSVVHVFYSKKELTYERQIIDLLHDLEKFRIPFKDVESDFEKHDDVSKPFVAYVKDYLNKKLHE